MQIGSNSPSCEPPTQLGLFPLRVPQFVFNLSLDIGMI